MISLNQLFHSVNVVQMVHGPRFNAWRHGRFDEADVCAEKAPAGSEKEITSGMVDGPFRRLQPCPGTIAIVSETLRTRQDIDPAASNPRSSWTRDRGAAPARAQWSGRLAGNRGLRRPFTRRTPVTPPGDNERLALSGRGIKGGRKVRGMATGSGGDLIGACVR